MSDELNFEKSTVFSILKEKLGNVGDNSTYQSFFGIDRKLFIDFLRDTQKEAYDKLHSTCGDTYIIENICKQMDETGVLPVLLNPITIKPQSGSGTEIRCFIKKPNNHINEEEWELFNKNKFFVHKELLYKNNSDQRIDISIGVNGIHLFAVELKNGTTQTYLDGERQLKFERDLNTAYFRHILCSFSMDRNYISFCSNLISESKFLPFNQGYNDGAGNPPKEYPNYPVEYFWDEVMTKDGIANLLQNYIYKDDEKGIIFPRYHQFTCTNKITYDVDIKNRKKILENYLIQAAPGSGKTLMIAWTAYKLSYLNDDNNKKVFDKVIVVSNRLIINTQLTTQIDNLYHQDGYVISPENSQDLASAINDGVIKIKGKNVKCEATIIVANLQKFLSAFDSISNTLNKKFAILIDEGHDSTSGEYMRAIKKATSQRSNKSIREYIDSKEPDVDWDIVASKIKALNSSAEGKQTNATYIAFTATPKGITRETFGTKVLLPDKTKYEAFYLYSMKQAIEEGFILDVLKNYTSYEMYCKATNKSKDTQIVDVMKATNKMFEMIGQDPEVIAKKTAIFMNFFRTKIDIMDGNAKAMIVTGGREQALHYYRCIEEYIKNNNLQFKSLIAFSGSLYEKGIELTEENINNLKEDTTLEKEFHKNKNYKILVVADKYTTGFDEDYLCYMMVDNPLHGTKVVQTLSRLNRICNKYPGKRTHIIDYVNDYDDVLTDFSEYYSDAKYYKMANNDDLNTLSKIVDNLGLVKETDIKNAYKYILVRKYYPNDEVNAKLSMIIRNTRDKLNEIVNEYSNDENVRNDYRVEIIWKIRRFVRLYDIVSNLRRIDDDDITARHCFYQYFLACIKTRTADPTNEIVEENVDFTDVEFNRLKTIENPKYNENVSITSSSGSIREKAKPLRDDLDAVIKKFNDNIGLKPEDSLHNDLKDYLLNNEYCQRILKHADEYYEFEEPIMYTSMDDMNNCNVYFYIMNHKSYQKLQSNEEVIRNWKDMILRPILQEIWTYKK